MRRSLKERDIMAVHDITGPHFRMDQKSTRVTDTLLPEYIYDGGPTEQVVTRIPKHGQMYPRKPEEDFALVTADVNKGTGRKSTAYPIELIKTREALKTDDILGAQAGTMPTRGPRYWCVRPTRLCVCVCVCVYIYIYIYIERERTYRG